MFENPIRWLANFVYGSTPAEFKSSFPLDESVSRLKTACKSSVFKAFGSQEAVGKVSESSVRLQRVIPFVGNSFKPFFFGSFHQVDGRVILSGHFAMHWLVKAFFSLWFGFILLITGSDLVHALPSNDKWHRVLNGSVMLLFGYALIMGGKWFARNDIAWLSERIRKALT
jgi:hypothetical protein